MTAAEWSIEQVFVVEIFLRSRVSQSVRQKRVIPEAPLGLVIGQLLFVQQLGFSEVLDQGSIRSTSFVLHHTSLSMRIFLCLPKKKLLDPCSLLYILYIIYLLLHSVRLYRTVSPLYQKTQSCIASQLYNLEQNQDKSLHYL